MTDNSIEIWTVDASIEDVIAQQREDQCYVSTEDGGTVESHSYWEVLDHAPLSKVQIPYVGEEDEIRDTVLIPAIEEYLREFNYIGKKEVVEFTGDCLEYTVVSVRSDRPLFRVILG